MRIALVEQPLTHLSRTAILTTQVNECYRSLSITFLIVVKVLKENIFKTFCLFIRLTV